MFQKVFFENPAGEGNHGDSGKFLRSRPKVIEPLPDIVVLARLNLRRVIEGDEMGAPLDMLAGAKEHRLYGKPRQIHDPFAKALLQGFAGEDAAPRDGVGILLDLFHQENLPLGVFYDDPRKILNFFFHGPAPPGKVLNIFHPDRSVNKRTKV